MKKKDCLSSGWSTFMYSLRKIIFVMRKVPEIYILKTWHMRNTGVIATCMKQHLMSNAVDCRNIFLLLKTGLHDAKQTLFLFCLFVFFWVCLSIYNQQLCYLAQYLPFSKYRDCSGLLWYCRPWQVTVKCHDIQPCCQPLYF